MKLTLEQIKSITTGALDIVEAPDGIHFYRFTKQQLQVFGAKKEQYRLRSHCTAGCQLSFYTNSQMLRLDVAQGNKFEIWIDGLPSHFFALESAKVLSVPLAAGEKHVVITLPNYSEGVLTAVHLDENAYIRPYRYDRRFLFLGDSITQGASASMDSCCYVSRVCRFFDAQILNQGVGGSCMFADTLEKTDFHPDVVFISYGTNDYVQQTSPEALEASVRDYFDRVRDLYPQQPIYYISPLWRADGDLLRKTGTLDDCRKIMIDQCSAHGFTHIDGYRLVPHSPIYFGDGYLHPNDLGFSHYAENLIKFLQCKTSSL